MDEISRVGPKGYIHGWIHVGVPKPGAKVFHPSHGSGTVSTHSSEYMSVHFDSGHRKEFRVGHPVSAKPEHRGWSPPSKDTHVNIEAAGTGGTASGPFRRVKPAATLDREGDSWRVTSATGGGTLGLVRPSSSKPGQWAAYTEDPVTGARELAYHGSDYMAAVTAILGHPPYGHSWYRVARGDPGETVKGRPARRTDDVNAAARAAGMLTNPGGTERLHQYWVHGEGAAKIRWGSPGDFDRCVLHLGKFIKDPQGYCNLAHHAALGIYPATHAAMEHKAGRSAPVADKKPYGNVTYADSKNSKYPIDTEAHCRAAWAYINMPKNASQYPMNGVTLSEVKDRIRAAMKRIGADVGDSETASDKASASRSAPGELLRFYPLEDIHILTRSEGDGSGRVVEAYATVFDTEAEIHDHQGHYMEVIDRAAFDDVLARIRASRGGLAASVKVLFNHGKTVEGTPAPEFQLPIGVPLDVRPEPRGLLTRTEYDAGDPFTERVLSKIRSGAITAQSFVGGIVRSSPELRGPGDKHRARGGALTTVRRMALGLREYGPVLFPAYSGAEILGVRMQLPGSVTDGGFTQDEDEASVMEEALTGGVPEDTTSARYHQHALYRLKSQEQRERIGLNW